MRFDRVVNRIVETRMDELGTGRVAKVNVVSEVMRCYDTVSEVDGPLSRFGLASTSGMGLSILLFSALLSPAPSNSVLIFNYPRDVKSSVLEHVK